MSQQNTAFAVSTQGRVIPASFVASGVLVPMAPTLMVTPGTPEFETAVAQKKMDHGVWAVGLGMLAGMVGGFIANRRAGG